MSHSNALARARWSPDSVWEPRIVAIAAATVRDDDPPLHLYRVSIHHIHPLDGRDRAAIRRAIRALMGRFVWIDEPGGCTAYALFSRLGYVNGYLEFEIHPNIRHHFISLRQHFTSYPLAHYLRLASVYAQRLYVFLTSWASIGVKEIPIGELHAMIGTDGITNYRKNSALFIQKVLMPAHRHIHECTDLRYTWEPIRHGRKVTAIRFVFPHAPAPEASTTLPAPDAQEAPASAAAPAAVPAPEAPAPASAPEAPKKRRGRPKKAAAVDLQQRKDELIEMAKKLCQQFSE